MPAKALKYCLLMQKSQEAIIKFIRIDIWNVLDACIQHCYLKWIGWSQHITCTIIHRDFLRDFKQIHAIVMAQGRLYMLLKLLCLLYMIQIRTLLSYTKQGSGTHAPKHAQIIQTDPTNRHRREHTCLAKQHTCWHTTV